MKESQRHKELETILVLILALGLLYWRYKNNYFLLAAFVTGIIGLFIPAAGKMIHRLWMKLATGMGFVMGKLVLVIIFIIIVIPLGWITGKLGKSSVKLKPGGPSYFKERNHVFTKADLEHPW